MGDQQSTVSQEKNQSTKLSFQEKIFYGWLFVIFPLVCSAGLVSLSVQALDSLDSENFANSRTEAEELDDKAFTSVLGRGLTEYCHVVHGQSAQIQYCLLKRDSYSYDEPLPTYFAWVKVQDKGRLLCQGIVKIAAKSKARFVVESFVNSKALLEEPPSDKIAPYYITEKMNKLLSRAEPELIVKPSDSQLGKLLNAERASLDQIRDMLHSDRQLTYVSYSHINQYKLPDESLSESLQNAAITKGRYELYLKLLDNGHCQSVSYGAESDTKMTFKKNEIWYQMWRPLSGEMVAKWIVYSKGTPRGCAMMANTDMFQPLGKNRMACAKVGDHWYVAYGDRPDLFKKRENSAEPKPSDAQLRKVFAAQKSNLEKLSLMLFSDKHLYCVGGKFINVIQVNNMPLPEDLKEAQITEARYQNYLDLLKKVKCQILSYAESRGSTERYANRNEVWYLFWAPPINGQSMEAKFIVFSKTGLPPKDATVVQDTDKAIALSEAEAHAMCSKLDSHWYILYGQWPYSPSKPEQLSDFE